MLHPGAPATHRNLAAGIALGNIVFNCFLMVPIVVIVFFSLPSYLLSGPAAALAQASAGPAPGPAPGPHDAQAPRRRKLRHRQSVPAAADHRAPPAAAAAPEPAPFAEIGPREGIFAALELAPELPAGAPADDVAGLSSFSEDVIGTLGDFEVWDVDGIKAYDINPEFVTACQISATWVLCDVKTPYAFDEIVGVQITKEPMLLYIYAAPGRVAAEDLKALLADAQTALCSELEARARNRLFLDPALEHPWQLKHRGKRTVSATHLYEALRVVANLTSFAGLRLGAVWFGMKIAADDDGFYEKLVDAMMMTGASSHSYLDLAIELGTNRSPGPWVAKQNHQFAGDQTDCFTYPMFPGLGEGAGGVTFNNVTYAYNVLKPHGPPRRGHDVDGDVAVEPADADADVLIKVKAYSVWAHLLKEGNCRARLPMLVPMKENRVTAKKDWFQKRIIGIHKLYQRIRRPSAASGLRVELRLTRGQLDPDWQTMKEKLLVMARATLRTIYCKPLSLTSVISELHAALRQAAGAGLFETESCRFFPGKAPRWKVEQYYRLLAHFGFVSKYWSDKAMSLHDEGVSWGLPVIIDVGPAGQRPAAPVVVISDHRALELIGSLNPACWLDEVVLSDDELGIYQHLCSYPGGPRRRGKRFPFYVQYRRGFGNPGRQQSRSLGYASVEALARVIWIWAGEDWINRIR